MPLRAEPLPARRERLQFGRATFECDVRIFGLPREITELRHVEIQLKDGAGLREVVHALRHKVPALEGPVIRAGEDRLVEFFKFNINGKLYFDDMDVQLHSGDYIALLTRLPADDSCQPARRERPRTSIAVRRLLGAVRHVHARFAVVSLASPAR